MARIISNWPGEPFDVEMIYERGQHSEPGSDKGQLFAIQASQRRRVLASEPAVIGVKRTLLLSLSWHMNDLMDDCV